MRLNRRIGRPILGRFVSDSAYDAIRDRFRPTNVTADRLMVDVGETARATDILARHGVVILPGLIAPDLADAACREADALVARIEAAAMAPQGHGMVDGISWQVDGAHFPGQKAIEARESPLANMRSRAQNATNGGVMDFYFLDKAARSHGWPALSACCAVLESGLLPGIIGAVSSARCSRINLLRNESATATRGLHVDNLLGTYKAFLYLNDVRDAGDGPYAYVPGSHRHRDLLKRQARLNVLSGKSENDADSFAGHELPLFAEKGTVIVSCQSGVHRGMPQRPGASRSVLVAHYRS